MVSVPVIVDVRLASVAATVPAMVSVPVIVDVRLASVAAMVPVMVSVPVIVDVRLASVAAMVPVTSPPSNPSGLAVIAASSSSVSARSATPANTYVPAQPSPGEDAERVPRQTGPCGVQSSAPAATVDEDTSTPSTR